MEKQTKIEAAIKSIKNQINHLEQQILIIEGKRDILREQVDYLENIQENKNLI